MTQTVVPLNELVAVRECLVELIHEGLTDNEREFLISFKSREPNWDLLGLDSISQLPAIKWKQINLAKMPEVKHKQALGQLESILAK